MTVASAVPQKFFFPTNLFLRLAAVSYAFFFFFLGEIMAFGLLSVRNFRREKEKGRKGGNSSVGSGREKR